MKHIVLAVAATCSIIATVGAQNSGNAKQPTLAETVSWLMTEAPPILTYTQGPRPGRPGMSRRWIHDLRIVDCRMGWEDSHALNVNATTGKAEKVNASEYRVPLGDLDVAGIHLRTFAPDDYVIVEFGPRSSKPGIPYRVTSPVPVQRSDTARFVGFAVRSSDDGKRVAAAIKRAAILCGAPASP